MHNMIIEDKCDVEAPIGDLVETLSPEVEMVVDEDTRFQESLLNIGKLKIKILALHFEMH